MKQSYNSSEHILHQLTICDLTSGEQRAISGGNFAEDIGYAFGYSIGFFLGAGPGIVYKAAGIARLLM